MKGELKEVLQGVILGLIMVVAIVAFVVVVSSAIRERARLEERLSCIAEIAEKQAYDEGDTTDMWWAVVEIAREIK